MEYSHKYNIAREFDTAAFWRIVKKIDAATQPRYVQDLLEDPLDGTLIKTYSFAGDTIRVYCDWDVGAVYVDSTIDLDGVIGEDQWNKQNP